MLFLGRCHTGTVVMRQRTALKEMSLRIKACSARTQGSTCCPVGTPVAVLSLESLVSLTCILSLKELSCHADAIYSNVINLAPRKEDDFAVYANVPPFNRPRRTSPDHVEYASIVFH